jgi:2-polyprenyl-6-hydroxyphenyl methylase/3-demethylubiquinone-9 3-methyltransferase
MPHRERPLPESWDTSTNEEFFDYYATQSQSPATIDRFRRCQDTVLRVANKEGLSGPLRVADIGCGAGTQARLWAERGDHVFGLDVNEPLIQLARSRAAQAGLDIKFEVGAANSLPWRDKTMDVCLLPELLEHVADWRACLNEAVRILKTGGLLYLSTTNFLCPKQDEFSLPCYSWYPSPVKRYCERLAVTSRPSIAHYAKYPAVNWFSFYSLRDYLEPLGFKLLDRFDLIDIGDKGVTARRLVDAVRRFSALRLLGHIATPSTYLVGVKLQS